MTEQEAWDQVYDNIADNATAEEWHIFVAYLSVFRSSFRAGWRMREVAAGHELFGTTEGDGTSSAEAQPSERNPFHRGGHPGPKNLKPPKPNQIPKVKPRHMGALETYG